MKRSICGPTTALVKHGRLCLVTSPSTIQSGRIQVLTHGRQSVFTMTICRRLRQHKFSPPLPGLTPVGLKPSLREAPATAHEPNRQRIHLAEPKRCLDEAGHLCLHAAIRSELSIFHFCPSCCQPRYRAVRDIVGAGDVAHRLASVPALERFLDLVWC